MWYTSTDGEVVEPYDTTVFGANIVSNTYENGKGVITFDGDVTTIGIYAFYYCSSLASVTIPGSVTSIGEGAFAGCSSLASVTIPDSVTEIGDFAFYYSSSLASVYCKATTPPSLGGSVFYDNASELKIYVPTESVEAYQTAPNWSDYAEYIEPYNFE
ncbi:MAG: leucine-rich repeat domain-containing protein [Tidjanibacter sp.]|nr:leucine-rich repeat domain-containing protein [Tidjanibacter sp.]